MTQRVMDTKNGIPLMDEKCSMCDNEVEYYRLMYEGKDIKFQIATCPVCKVLFTYRGVGVDVDDCIKNSSIH
jgi:hypothetical protein